ncbi:MAG: IdeS/Mac family cysteine endopeptidase, partial [Treponema sp.]
ESNLNLEIKTLHGKLSYTPIIVGEESGWLSIVSTDTTISTEKDTIYLKAAQNKTVWKRTAYINFKDGSNQEIKNADGEKLEVKVIQKGNEHPNVTIKWVHGIDAPTPSEKTAIPVCKARKEDGEWTTEKQFYWDDSKIFWWYESNTTKWFNNRKLLNLGVTADKNAADSNQCWAKTASNMLHWWFVQNKTYIDRYKRSKSSEEQEKYQDYYKRELYSENKSEEEKKEDKEKEREKSYIANTFRVKAHNGNKGDYIISGLSWYLYGNETTNISRPGENAPALFKDVFSKKNTPIERTNVHDKAGFNKIISNALDSEKAIGIDIWGTKGGNEYGHAITLWGAAFDEEENIIAIYVVDNNFAANRIFPYGIWYKEGKPYLFNYGVNQFVKDRYVGQVTTLDKGEAQWKAWQNNHP